MGLRVLTLNLWALNGDWPARRAVLIEGLRECNPTDLELLSPS